MAKPPERAPTPYEVARDFAQIFTNVFLTFSIIALMASGFIEDKILRGIILVCSLVIALFAILYVYKFKKNWVTWVKKK